MQKAMRPSASILFLRQRFRWSAHTEIVSPGKVVVKDAVKSFSKSMWMELTWSCLLLQSLTLLVGEQCEETWRSLAHPSKSQHKDYLQIRRTKKYKIIKLYNF